MSFQVQHEKTKIFGCQNPFRQGGGRKGLPRSFLNRFTQVRFTVAQKPKVVLGVIIAMRVPTRRMRQAQCNSLLLDFMSGCDGC